MPDAFCVIVVRKNTASESIKQKLVFAGSEEGRSGRAGRSGEAITFYSEVDIPYSRNVANVMAGSGCEVPSWIMALPKLKGKKHQPQRDSISTKPNDADEY
ncbi:hypothetical protein SLEP1_g39016 [Rubroshorea leprosula]|uniref:Uncharacterized protein n=1 Tax=Rubroshorea leprosula TaxID=152421 RepID=A0AAV5KZ88_9ROSI|nr:hypothetical protein SLEP1_g39016 [Rubroshorea leprosula]